MHNFQESQVVEGSQKVSYNCDLGLSLRYATYKNEVSWVGHM